MTNFFGPRDSGFLVVDRQRIHPGLDTTTFCGDQIRAAHKGTVVAVGRRFASEVGFSGPLDRFYARIARNHTMGLQPIVVVVDDGNGYRSMYVHLGEALVKKGDKVTRRTVIGLEGDTGNASGCHVHYELIRMDGRWMRVARQLVDEYGYPEWQRERVDPLRVLSLKEKRSGRFVPGIPRPTLPPSLRAPKKHPGRKASATEPPASASPAVESSSPHASTSPQSPAVGSSPPS
jgi:murein DD-endopeptidase MepM/ murein hydrolase activator NlpD